MAELESRLEQLAGAVEWPSTPDLREPVRRAIARRSRPWFESRWALAAVAVIVILALLLGYAPSRTAIADWINLHTGLIHTTSVPTPSPLPSGPIGKRLGLGTPSSLAAARSSIGWNILVPAELGQPDEVYVQTTDAPTGGEVTLVYGPRAGIPPAGQTGASVLVTEARGTVEEQFFGKIAGPGTTISPVTVGNIDGWWISGSPHVFFFTDASGTVRYETLRLATNTLILDVGGTVVRIEGNLTFSQAEAIALSLR